MRIKQGTPEGDDVEIVQYEVNKRNKNETVEQLVELQLVKAKKLAIGTSYIDGIFKAGKDMINAETDVIEIPVLLKNLKIDAEKLLEELLV